VEFVEFFIKEAIYCFYEFLGKWKKYFIC